MPSTSSIREYIRTLPSSWRVLDPHGHPITLPVVRWARSTGRIDTEFKEWLPVEQFSLDRVSNDLALWGDQELKWSFRTGLNAAPFAFLPDTSDDLRHVRADETGDTYKHTSWIVLSLAAAAQFHARVRGRHAILASPVREAPVHFFVVLSASAAESCGVWALGQEEACRQEFMRLFFAFLRGNGLQIVADALSGGGSLGSGGIDAGHVLWLRRNGGAGSSKSMEIRLHLAAAAFDLADLRRIMHGFRAWLELAAQLLHDRKQPPMLLCRKIRDPQLNLDGSRADDVESFQHLIRFEAYQPGYLLCLPYNRAPGDLHPLLPWAHSREQSQPELDRCDRLEILLRAQPHLFVPSEQFAWPRPEPNLPSPRPSVANERSNYASGMYMSDQDQDDDDEEEEDNEDDQPPIPRFAMLMRPVVTAVDFRSLPDVTPSVMHVSRLSQRVTRAVVTLVQEVCGTQAVLQSCERTAGTVVHGTLLLPSEAPCPCCSSSSIDRPDQALIPHRRRGGPSFYLGPLALTFWCAAGKKLQVQLSVTMESMLRQVRDVFAFGPSDHILAVTVPRPTPPLQPVPIVRGGISASLDLQLCRRALHRHFHPRTLSERWTAALVGMWKAPLRLRKLLREGYRRHIGWHMSSCTPADLGPTEALNDLPAAPLPYASTPMVRSSEIDAGMEEEQARREANEFAKEDRWLEQQLGGLTPLDDEEFEKAEAEAAAGALSEEEEEEEEDEAKEERSEARGGLKEQPSSDDDDQDADPALRHGLERGFRVARDPSFDSQVAADLEKDKVYVRERFRKYALILDRERVCGDMSDQEVDKFIEATLFRFKYVMMKAAQGGGKSWMLDRAVRQFALLHPGGRILWLSNRRMYAMATHVRLQRLRAELAGMGVTFDFACYLDDKWRESSQAKPKLNTKINSRKAADAADAADEKGSCKRSKVSTGSAGPLSRLCPQASDSGARYGSGDHTRAQWSAAELPLEDDEAMEDAACGLAAPGAQEPCAAASSAGYRLGASAAASTKLGDQQRVVCSLESIARLVETADGHTPQPYQLIILDEVEELRSNFRSCKTMGDKRPVVWQHLVRLLREAEYVWVADADLDVSRENLGGVRFMEEMLQQRDLPADYNELEEEEMHEDSNAELSEEQVQRRIRQKKFFLIWNIRPSIRRFYFRHPLEESCVQALLTSLKLNRRVVVVTNSKAKADFLAHYLYQHPDLHPLFQEGERSMRVLTGATEQSRKMEFMQQKHLWRVSVLIYSPVISSGVDYSLPVFTKPWFDEAFLFATDCSSTVRQVFQQLNRVRQLSRGHVHFHLDVTPARWCSLPVTLEAVRAETNAQLQRCKSFTVEGHTLEAILGPSRQPALKESSSASASYNVVYLLNVLERNRSQRFFAELLQRLMVASGGTLFQTWWYVSPEEMQRMAIGHVEAAQNEHALIARADVWTAAQAQRRQHLDLMGLPRGPGDKYALLRFELSAAYQHAISSAAIDAAFVERYGPDAIRRAFARLRDQARGSATVHAAQVERVQLRKDQPEHCLSATITNLNTHILLHAMGFVAWIGADREIHDADTIEALHDQPFVGSTTAVTPSLVRIAEGGAAAAAAPAPAAAAAAPAASSSFSSSVAVAVAVAMPMGDVFSERRIDKKSLERRLELGTPTRSYLVLRLMQVQSFKDAMKHRLASLRTKLANGVAQLKRNGGSNEEVAACAADLSKELHCKQPHLEWSGATMVATLLRAVRQHLREQYRIKIVCDNGPQDTDTPKRSRQLRLDRSFWAPMETQLHPLADRFHHRHLDALLHPLDLQAIADKDRLAVNFVASTWASAGSSVAALPISAPRSGLLVQPAMPTAPVAAAAIVIASSTPSPGAVSGAPVQVHHPAAAAAAVAAKATAAATVAAASAVVAPATAAVVVRRVIGAGVTSGTGAGRLPPPPLAPMDVVAPPLPPLPPAEPQPYPGHMLRVPGLGDCALLALLVAMLAPVVRDEGQFYGRLHRFSLRLVPHRIVAAARLRAPDLPVRSPTSISFRIYFLRYLHHSDETSWLSRSHVRPEEAASVDYLGRLMVYVRGILSLYVRGCPEFHFCLPPPTSPRAREAELVRIASPRQWLDVDTLRPLASLMGLRLSIQNVTSDETALVPIGRWMRNAGAGLHAGAISGWRPTELLPVTIRFVNFLSHLSPPPLEDPNTRCNHYAGIRFD